MRKTKESKASGGPAGKCVLTWVDKICNGANKITQLDDRDIDIQTSPALCPLSGVRWRQSPSSLPSWLGMVMMMCVCSMWFTIWIKSRLIVWPLWIELNSSLIILFKSRVAINHNESMGRQHFPGKCVNFMDTWRLHHPFPVLDWADTYLGFPLRTQG